MTQWILCTYLLFSGVGVAAAQITTKLAQETQVTWIQDTGKRAKVKLEPIALGSDWTPVQVIQSLNRIKMAAPTLALRVDDKEALASATRVVVHASYDGLPVFDRDAIAIVSNAGIITSVRGNLPQYHRHGDGDTTS